MTKQQPKTFKEIYIKYRDKFKNEIKEEFIELLFNEDKNNRKDLLTRQTATNVEPEALTEDIIIAMLKECGIESLDIKRQKVLDGVNDIFKKVKRKPDFYILNADPNKKGLLFEIEHLNKDLEKEGDGEGIEQALEWYRLDPSFAFEYDCIITNFHEWFILSYNLEKRSYEVIPKKPREALEYITNVKFGRGREYLLELEEQKRDITDQFYIKFQERLKKLLGRKSSLQIDIKVLNYKKSEEQTREEYENELISYYRIIFSRLLFIKILISWKMLEFDPLSLILKKEMIYWNTELKTLFFDIFNKKPENRPKYIPKIFKNLPYLNGGLFRPSGIEMDNNGNLRDVYMNPEAVKDIWDFLKNYKFVKEENGLAIENHNTINPEILGYIFERSIGDERKKTGSYYTPEDLTDYMTENTIFPYIIEKVNENFNKILPIKEISDIDFLLNKSEIYLYILNNIIKKIKICDPACGSGAFLKKSADKLLLLYKKCYKGCGRELPFKLKTELKDSQMPFADIYSIKKHIIQNNIYGVDINKSAIELCELRLWLWTVKPPEELIGSKEYVDIPALPNIEYNIRCGNSLIGYYEIERLSEIGSDKFHRIDEKFLSRRGSAIIDILHQKQDLIACYYQKDEAIEESKKNEIRNAINTIVDDFKNQLNNLLLADFQNQNLTVPLGPVYLSGFIDDKDFEKKFQDYLREINIKNELVYFKINFKAPADIDYEAIRSIKGLTCSVNKKTNLVSSIYPTSGFNFKYFSEYGDYPFSKFLLKQVSAWSEVDNIEFKKKVGIKDLDLIDPFHWVMEFPSIFNNTTEHKKGFDIIIGNPPFIRADTEDEFFMLQRFILNSLATYKLLWEKWDIYVGFIERAIKTLLKTRGKFAFVVSEAICSVKYANKIRDWLQESFEIPLINYFEGYEVFKGVGINPILLFVNKRDKKDETHKIIRRNNFNIIASTFRINQDIEYFWKKKIPRILSFDIGDYELLGNICYISVGMVANAHEKIAKGEFIKDDLITDNYSEVNCKKYIEGKLISRYKIESLKYFEWGTERSPGKLRRPTFPELYQGKKILRGRMVDGIIDVNDIICNHTIVVFRKFINLKNVNNKSIIGSIKKKNPEHNREQLEDLSNRYSYEYLLALINSKYAERFFNVVRREKIKNMFYPDDFRKLPVKSIEDQSIFINIVNMLHFLYQYGGNKEIIHFLDDILLNYIIYELYFKEIMKKENFYYRLSEEISDIINKNDKIEYEKWIKLCLKSSLDENEMKEKMELEKINLKIINDIYDNINTESINKKIERMKEFEYISSIEKGE